MSPAPLTDERPSVVSSSRLVAGVAGVAVLAWAAVLATHGVSGHGGTGGWPSWAQRPVGWALMVLAMMVSPALPLFDTLRTLVRRHRRAGALVTWGATTFVGAWLLTGLAYLFLDRAFGLVTQSAPAALMHPVLLAGLTAALAGGYQLTPAKAACLAACRSPRSIALAAWTGARPPAVEVTVIAGRYAAACIGCCWALMLLTLVGGIASLPLMVALSLAMLAERFSGRPERVGALIARACFALGAILIVLYLLSDPGATPPAESLLTQHH